MLTTVLLILCILEQFVFFKTANENINFSQKQKAYILSLKSSLTMLFGSLYSNYIYFTQWSTMKDYLAKENFVDELLTIYFISYLIVDIVLGTIYYRKYLNNLSGYPHHIVYIIVCFMSLHQKSYKLFMLYMICELPTFILALGSYDERYRQNKLFGITFFLTRIVHFIYISSHVFNNTLYVSIACSILSVHVFWFYNWCKKYGMKIKCKL